MEFAWQTSGPYETVLRHALWAEKMGLVAFALPDHYVTSRSAMPHPAYDAFVQLGGLARETTLIELSVLVSPITFRHPAVIGKMALTVHDLSGGRFSLGVGTGWLEVEHALFGLPFPALDERYEMLAEALAYLRAMFDPEFPGYGGDRYELAAQPHAPTPSLPPSLVVGGVGKHKTPTLAGTYADEFNCYPGSPDEFAARVETARLAAEAAGRSAEDLLISSAGAVLTAPTEAEYKRLVERTAIEAEMTLDDLEAAMRHRNTPHGSHEQVVATLRELSASGVTRFYLQRGSEADLAEEAELIRLLREEVA